MENETQDYTLICSERLSGGGMYPCYIPTLYRIRTNDLQQMLKHMDIGCSLSMIFIGHPKLEGEEEQEKPLVIEEKIF